MGEWEHMQECIKSVVHSQRKISEVGSYEIFIRSRAGEHVKALGGRAPPGTKTRLLQGFFFHQ